MYGYLLQNRVIFVGSRINDEVCLSATSDIPCIIADYSLFSGSGRMSYACLLYSLQQSQSLHHARALPAYPEQLHRLRTSVCQ